jgi:hypothetical protein
MSEVVYVMVDRDGGKAVLRTKVEDPNDRPLNVQGECWRCFEPLNAETCEVAIGHSSRTHFVVAIDGVVPSCRRVIVCAGCVTDSDRAALHAIEGA